MTDELHYATGRVRSLEERCYLLWHESESGSGARDLFIVQCRCGASGAIRREAHFTVIKTVFWNPPEQAKLGGCPSVAKMIAEQLPISLEASSIDDLTCAQIRKLADEFRNRIRREAVETN